MGAKMQAGENTIEDQAGFETQLEQEGFAVEESSTDQAAEEGEAVKGEGEESIVSAAELEAARAEAAEAKDQMLRLAAECENFKKRMERERSNAFKYAEEGILRDLLPTIDNLSRAIEQGRDAEDVNSLLEGIEMTLKSLQATVEKYGLKAIEAVGEPFDPNFHEALAMETSDSIPANHVIQEFEKGYLFKDRLIRATKVVVAKENEED